MLTSRIDKLTILAIHCIVMDVDERRDLAWVTTSFVTYCWQSSSLHSLSTLRCATVRNRGRLYTVHAAARKLRSQRARHRFVSIRGRLPKGDLLPLPIRSKGEVTAINKEPHSIRRTTWTLRAIYFFLYASMGTLLPYLSPYFSGSGLAPSQIGLLLSIQPLVGTLIPPLWGMLADRTGKTLPWLRIQFILLPICVFALLHAHGTLSLALILIALAAFMTAVPPLIDHIAMGYVQADRIDYGRIRVFGSTGFSLANAVVGIFLLHAHLDQLFWLYIPAVLLALVMSLLVRERAASPLEQTTSALQSTPAITPDQLPAPSGLRAWQPLLGFFVTLLVFSLTVPMYNSYFPLYIEARHLPQSLISLSFMLSSGSELLTMPFASSLYARRGPRFMLTCSALAYVVRWTTLGFAHSPLLIVGAQLLHGVAFGFFYTSAVTYLRAAVPRSQLATGQTLFAATTALGNVGGNLYGGALFGAVGPAHFFQVQALVALSCVGFVWTLMRCKQPALRATDR